MLANPVLVVVSLVVILAELIKYGIRRMSDSSAKFGHPGGMPSGHSAGVASAATVVALHDGLASPLFGLAMVLLVIVAHDAVRLRGAVGKQAVKLNELLAVSKLTDHRPLYVWQGHRIREVAVGLLFGAVFGALFYWLMFAS